VCRDPTDLDRNLIERGYLRSEGPNMVVNLVEHELARRSLWVLHRLNSGLAVGENNYLRGLCNILMLVDEPGNRYFNAVKLSNVHY
jgi:hypothetical protein